MKRREFIGLGCGAIAWSRGARAENALPVIGYLGSASPTAWATRLQAFREGLGEAGFEENHNVAIDYRWAEEKYDRLPELARQLVARHVAVLVTPGSAPAALAAKIATQSIPIVFETGADPVAAGIVPSLSRPGGNVTGIAALTFETGPKRLEIVHEALPTANPIAVLANPKAGDVVGRQVTDLEASGLKLGLQLLQLHASNDRELEAAFAVMQAKHVGGLIITADPFANSRIKEIAALTLKHGVPAIFVNPQFASFGGLMSYSGNIVETHRLAGVYVGRILKGEKPADLPVIQGNKVELVINLKTAKALGLDLPPSLLARADAVIE